MADAKPKVACPKCGRTQPKRTSDSLYWCENCRAMHDDSPEEGGDYSDRDPSARIEREERLKQQRQQRKRRF